MKYLIFIPASLLTVFVLFLGMAQLAGNGKQYQVYSSENLSLNMLRMRFDSDLQQRQRRMPPPPPEEIIETPQSAAPQTTNIDIPKVDLPHVTTDLLDIPTQVQLAAAPPKVSDAMVEMALLEPTPGEIQMVKGQMPIKRFNPQYPRRAMQRKIQGHVVVQFLVDKDGRVDIDSLKFVEENPEGIFSNNVRKAVRKWRFNPMMQNGQPIAFRTQQRFEFSLGR
jgi:protein TonB